MDVHHLSEKLAKPIWEQLPDISEAKLEKTALLELDFLKYIDDRKHLFYNKDLITYSIIRYGEYCHLGSGGSKLRVQNKLDFIKKINGLQGNCCVLRIDIAWGLQKLGIILENKVCTSKFKVS